MDASNTSTAAATAGRQERVGVVVSDKMQKSVVVAVERFVRHGLYRKTLRRTSRFMAHDEKGAHRGDQVRIREARPLSKRKRWEVVEILKRASLAGESNAFGAAE
jgi:small subunit ribosomal protein S17